MKVYVVTEGEYSDYQIVQVCATRELAERLAKEEVGRVEEYDLLTELPRKVTTYFIEWYDNKVDEYQSVKWPWDTYLYNSNPNGRPKFQELRGGFRVWGTNRAKVRKAYQDRLSQLQATEAGI